MNRIEPLMAGRIVQHLRGGRGIAIEGDESLDLFSRIRHNQLANSRSGSEHQNVTITQEMTGMGSLAKSRMDDLLSADVGKHDYDWLLTPPGTPLFSFSEATDNPISKATPTSRPNARSVSTGKASRFSASQPENASSARPARSGSTTRSSISNTFSSSTYLSNNSRTAVLNTSTASVTSKPSTPGNRSTAVSKSRTTPSTPSQSSASRSSTPLKARTSLPSAADKPRPSQNSRPSTPTVRPSQNSRPSTPTVRPQAHHSITSNTSSSTAATRSNSRPSTPTRRATTPAASAPAMAGSGSGSASVGRVPAASNQKAKPASRPSSPAPRTREQAQTLAHPNFPLDVPPNLRTKVPERAVSASRQRPGTALTTARANSNSETAAAPASAVRRQSSSPIITRGRLQETSSSNRLNSKANEVKATENKKPLASEPGARRTAKPASLTENTGFGRSISKKSMDMALKHMDIRQSMGGIRGAALFPQSIRSAAQKGRPCRSPEPAAPSPDKQVPHIEDKGSISVAVVSNNDISNGMLSRCRNGVALRNCDVAVKPSNQPIMASMGKLDIYESSRYDSILPKEDSKNMNWLHSIEDKCDQSPPFDYRFGSLPEPFGLI